MKKKETCRFKKGEKVTDEYDRVGVVLEIVEGDSDYRFPFKCLVEFEDKKFFSGKLYKYTEWLNQSSLNKFV